MKTKYSLPIGLLVLLLILFTTTSFINSFTPPGTKKVKEVSLFVDKTEVLNEHWTEYLSYLKNTAGENAREFKEALPDSIVWNSVYKGSIVWNSVYKGSILRFMGKFGKYPVVGISYEQAENYCKWRTQLVREKYKRNVTYRLPTREEWVEIHKINAEKSTQKGLAEVKSANRILNLSDNVSEMTSENGIAMGMNWEMLFTLSESDQSEPIVVNYKQPTNWLGFRCVAEIDSN